MPPPTPRRPAIIPAKAPITAIRPSMGKEFVEVRHGLSRDLSQASA
jgi:hypothetical protein